MFYSIEGPEGSGKTTLLDNIKQELIKQDVQFMITREPGGTDVAEELRNIALSGRVDARVEAMLMYAARHEHYTKKIAPSLEKGITVLTDRYMDSTAVYNFLLQGKTYSEFLLWQNFFQDPNGIPRRTFLLDIPVEETLKRLSNRGKENKYDYLSEEGHRKIRDAYLQVALVNDERIIVLDGMKPIDVLTKEVLSYLN